LGVGDVEIAFGIEGEVVGQHGPTVDLTGEDCPRIRAVKAAAVLSA
jgi:hypothetical protein